MALPARPLSLLLYNQNLCDHLYGRWGFKIPHWPHIHCYGVLYVMLEARYCAWYKRHLPTASSLFLPLHQNGFLSSFKNCRQARHDLKIPSPSRLCPPQNSQKYLRWLGLPVPSDAYLIIKRSSVLHIVYDIRMFELRLARKVE